MSLWKWTGTNFEKCPWHNTNNRLKAVLYGSGTSLLYADKEPEGSVKFVQNRAHETVDPDIWIGMDLPENFKDDLFDTPFRKIFRGNYANIKHNGIPLKEYPETYFIDATSKKSEDIFFNRGLETQFYFPKHTMGTALHLILWMGFKHIVFSGIDLQGDYADKRKMSPEKADETKRLLDEEFLFMSWFIPAAINAGIKIENTSEKSRLKEILP
jgi:hypothetical protein